MRKVKKIFAPVLALCLTLSLLAGCGGSEVKATDYVAALHKYMCSGDKDAAKKGGVSDDTIKSFEETRKSIDSFGDLVTNSLNAEYKSMLDTQLVTDFSKAFSGCLSKIQVTTTEESKNGDEVAVKVESQYIDLNTLLQDSMKKAMEGVDLSKGDEAVKTFVTNYFKSLTDSLNNYKFPDDKRSQVIVVKKSGSSWEMKDSKNDTEILAETIIKME